MADLSEADSAMVKRIAQGFAEAFEPAPHGVKLMALAILAAATIRAGAQDAGAARRGLDAFRDLVAAQMAQIETNLIVRPQ
jgi:hypothetical protein